MVSKLKRRQRGEGLVSYLIVLAFVVLVCIAGARLLGNSINGVFQTSSGKVDEMREAVNKIKVN